MSKSNWEQEAARSLGLANGIQTREELVAAMLQLVWVSVKQRCAVDGVTLRGVTFSVNEDGDVELVARAEPPIGEVNINTIIVGEA